MARPRRNLAGVGLAALNRFAGSSVADRLNLRKPAGRAIYRATKLGFSVAGAAARPFRAMRKLISPARLEQPEGGKLFDLTPTEEQDMIRESVLRFARERLIPARESAETALSVEPGIRREAESLGLAQLAVSEELGGAGTERSQVTSALVHEAMGLGDMGQAVALLAPVGVANALAQWGSATQQARYLEPFASDVPPQAAIALHEPVPFFDPCAPTVSARRDGEQLILNGQKSLVPLAMSADFFIVSAQLEDGGGSRLILIEAATSGLSVAAEPAMGLRAAALGRINLHNASVPMDRVIGDAATVRACVDLSRLAWCALGTGAAQAVLDYVIPYVNDREAFGEPISHRQGVAFPVADIGIEVEAMRLMTWRAAARAEIGRNHAREATLAYRLCVDKAMQIGSSGVQLLGGHGFVKEHPVERWYRDLRAVGTMEGGVML